MSSRTRLIVALATMYSRSSAVTICLYTIEAEDSDGWIKNDNSFNNLDTEYKTPNWIQHFTCEEIQLGAWLVNKKLVIT